MATDNPGSEDKPKEKDQEGAGEEAGGAAPETPEAASGDPADSPEGEASAEEEAAAADDDSTVETPSPVDVRGIDLGEVASAAGVEVGSNLEMLLDIPMPVTVEVGRAKVLLEEVLQIGPGFVLPLEKKVGDPVDLMINGKRVAEGEVVAVEEQLAIRITRVLGEVS